MDSGCNAHRVADCSLGNPVDSDADSPKTCQVIKLFINLQSSGKGFPIFSWLVRLVIKTNVLTTCFTKNMVARFTIAYPWTVTMSLDLQSPTLMNALISQPPQQPPSCQQPQHQCCQWYPFWFSCCQLVHEQMICWSVGRSESLWFLITQSLAGF